MANINSISEGQLRDWIRWYKVSGEGALEDNRGNKKSEEFLSNKEIFKRKNKELEEKNRRLEAELLLLKKLKEFRRGSDIRKYLQLKFLAIKDVASFNNYSIKFLCEILKINRKSYYKWLKRIPSKREKKNEIIKEKILEIHNRVKGIYGSCRMTININRELDKKYNYKRIYRLMKEELKISSRIRRKKRKYIKSSAEYKVENILNREFTAQKPLEKILTDITEFKYGDGKKVYMCTTLDLYDKSILSYSISTKATLELALETLKNSYQEKSREKRILHSDREYQFTSYEYKRELKRLGITHSMSRVGKCIDNGPMEGF